MYGNLSPQRALVWRILHRDNLPWVLKHGLHSGNSHTRASNWTSIGHAELIARRATHPVPISPGGALGDYVPFYFTPFSVMLRNIQTGWADTPRVDNDDIVILVSSLLRLRELGLRFLFTDRHAYSSLARYFDDLSSLDNIDWAILQRRDFRRDPEDPGKLERYQAEALVYKHVPLDALLGVVCYSDLVRDAILSEMSTAAIQLPVYTRPNWYFQ